MDKLSSLGFIFFDGHALANLSEAFDTLSDLERVDWDAVNAEQWSNTPDDLDRQRRKQAEFLCNEIVPWRLITESGSATKW